MTSRTTASAAALRNLLTASLFDRNAAAGLAAVALAVAALVAAPPARAQKSIDAASLGAAVAIPYLTSTDGEGERITVATVTNGLYDEAVNLHLIWISGDEGDSWSALDFNCPLTPLETTWFVFENENGTARVTFECSDLGQVSPDPDSTNNIFVRSVPGEDGILFVALECQLGSIGCPGGVFGLRTLPTNALLADSTVIDMGMGYAFSVEALHIQGISNNGDRLYQFDGAEYAAFPSALATSYIAPDDDITLELLAFTLDGKVNDGPGIVAKLFGFAFDDDENATSGAIEFDCFVLQDLTAPPNRGFGANITREFGGHLAGHIELFPTDTTAHDAHENNPVTGDGNGSRRRPVYGWIVQTIGMIGNFDDFNFPMGGSRMASPGAWARGLVSGNSPLVPIGDDTPSLNADGAAQQPAGG